MFYLVLGIITRIFSNSYLNVFQKILTSGGEKASVVNFYTYIGLLILGFAVCPHPVFSTNLIPTILAMGLMGALGNYFIIKALSYGELSTLAPINSYKPLVALLFGIIFLDEIPGLRALIGLVFIIAGTLFLTNTKFLYSKACLYRILALLFSGTEAVFIKMVILQSNISSAFLYWAAAGLLFSMFLALKSPLKISKSSIKYQIYLILAVGIMQYSTNFVFSRMNVSYALALFQLSTILSVFLGINVFHEKGLLRKLSASLIMLTGAVILILG